MSYMHLILFMIIVESRGVNDAIGDNGKAVGCLQIHKVVIDDVNGIYDTSYEYDDRYDRDKSIEVAKLYLTHYASEKRLNRQPTIKDAARIWDGGPNGHKKEATLPYWEKVKKQIERNQYYE